MDELVSSTYYFFEYFHSFLREISHQTFNNGSDNVSYELLFIHFRCISGAISSLTINFPRFKDSLFVHGLKKVDRCGSGDDPALSDETGVGGYIIEDMERGGLRHVTGMNFTEPNKESMATCLKEKMRSSVCLKCGWEGYIDTLEGEWRTTCLQGCRSEEGNPQPLRPILHISFDADLFHELNVERFELAKMGKISFNHPEGTNDDRFWAVALAVYAAEQAPPPPSMPVARTI